MGSFGGSQAVGRGRAARVDRVRRCVVRKPGVLGWTPGGSLPVFGKQEASRDHAHGHRNGCPTCCTRVLKRGNQFGNRVVEEVAINGETFSFGYAEQAADLTAGDLDANAGEETNKY